MSKFLDITNQKFGKLTAIKAVERKNGHTYWECLCDCGNNTIVALNELRRKNRTKVKSCGCVRQPNLVGKIFGRLTVECQNIEMTNKSTNNQRYWNCICICGNRTITITSSLMRGSTTSCGCYNRDIVSQTNSFSNEEDAVMASARKAYSSYKELNGISFEDFLIKSQEPCFYCGTNQYNKYNKFLHREKYGAWASNFAKENGWFEYNGLDRIDNNIGHTKENVVSCCLICNRFKSNRKLENVLKHFNIMIADPLFLGPNELIKNDNILSSSHSYVEIVNLLCQTRRVGYNRLINKIHNCEQKAKSRGIEFKLSKIQSIALVISKCNYCGIEADLVSGQFNGIDRVNNDLDYLPENCVSCCKYCNGAKNNNSIENFLQWISAIYTYKNIRNQNVQMLKK